MKCLEYEELLQRQLDGEPIAFSPELEQHIAGCFSCRVLQASLQVLQDGLKNLPAPVGPLDLTQRLTGLVMEDRRLRRHRMHQRLVITTALAASVVVMAMAGYFLLPVPLNTNNLAANVPEKSPLLAKSVDDARNAFSSLSERWAEKARQRTQLFLVAANAIEIPDVDNLAEMAEPLELEPAAQSLRKAGQGIADNLQPVAKSARRALIYFFRELPVLQAKR